MGRRRFDPCEIYFLWHEIYMNPFGQRQERRNGASPSVGKADSSLTGRSQGLTARFRKDLCGEKGKIDGSLTRLPYSLTTRLRKEFMWRKRLGSMGRRRFDPCEIYFLWHEIYMNPFGQRQERRNGASPSVGKADSSLTGRSQGLTARFRKDLCGEKGKIDGSLTRLPYSLISHFRNNFMLSKIKKRAEQSTHQKNISAL